MGTLHGSHDAQQTNAATLFDLLGPALCRLAGVLTGDADLAEHMVVTAIAEHRSGDSPRNDQRTLSGAIYLDWASRTIVEPVGHQIVTHLQPAPSPSDEILRDLRALPYDQLAAIALCKFGAHSYRQAADLLGVPAAELAQTLCAALRNLDRPTLGRTLPSPAA